jgi:hypothetical protein
VVQGPKGGRQAPTIATGHLKAILNLLLVCGGHKGLPPARQLPEQALQQGIITQIVLAVVAADQALLQHQ